MQWLQQDASICEENMATFVFEPGESEVFTISATDGVWWSNRARETLDESDWTTT